MAAKIKTTEEYIEIFKNIHDDLYDYTNMIYVNYVTPVEVICRIHGIFKISVNKHRNGRGCQKCSLIKENYRKKNNPYKANQHINVVTTDIFIERSSKTHNNYYIYDKTNYITQKVPVIITCPIHGDFSILPVSHLYQNCGCKKCFFKSRETSEKIIEKFKITHGDKYLYDKVQYINMHTNILIGCSKHGYFEQTPNSHFRGRGCPHCLYKSERLLYEKIQKEFNDIEVIHQPIGKVKPKWLETQTFDIYIPKYNIAIEYQGEQHYKSLKCFGGDEKFEINKKRDFIKREKCLKNNCLLIEYPFFEKSDEYFKKIVNIINERIKLFEK